MAMEILWEILLIAPNNNHMKWWNNWQDGGHTSAALIKISEIYSYG